MGADIHLYAERRNSAGAWQLIEPDRLGTPFRSYHVFNRLAGVRQSIVRERGDMSEPIARSSWTCPGTTTCDACGTRSTRSDCSSPRTGSSSGSTDR
jgi:hypothetical protein